MSIGGSHRCVKGETKGWESHLDMNHAALDKCLLGGELNPCRPYLFHWGNVQPVLESEMKIGLR